MKRITISDLAKELRLDVTVVISAARRYGAAVRKKLPGSTIIISRIAGNIRKKYAAKKLGKSFIAVSHGDGARTTPTDARRRAERNARARFVQGGRGR